jgi:CDP-paratose 2-epimerase
MMPFTGFRAPGGARINGDKRMKILITGGAGFIGCNTALHFARAGHKVTVFDNLSRSGTALNLRYLLEQEPGIRFVHGDVRHRDEVEAVMRGGGFDVVFHLAAQVAVTTSVRNPREDFEINAAGAFNMLEAMRVHCPEGIAVYSSTNKVYGGMTDLAVCQREGHYEFRDLPEGVAEDRPLDFHSPYGCSKGAADQYFRDYHRIYGLRTVVFRQSCIYGFRQFGIEDQGWVAWFTIAAALRAPLTIYGDGRQVRDVLFVTDLVRAYELAVRQIRRTAGEVYNIGGGGHRLSLLELLRYLEAYTGKRIPVKFADWRPGDQKVYVSDIRKAARDFGWQPEISVAAGVRKLHAWVKKERATFVELGLIR